MQFYNSGDLPTDYAKKSFANNLLRIFPNGEAPLFAMSGLARKKRALQIQHGYWAKTMQFANVTLTAAVPDDTTTQFTVANTTSVSKDDVLRIPAAFSGGNYVAPELVRVTSVDSATQFTVERGFADSTPVTSIANGTQIPGIGNAYAEGSTRPVSKAIVPELTSNYTHIFRNAWSQTKTLAAIQQVVGKGTVAENKIDAAGFHGRDIELATFFSRRSLETDPVSGEPIHTMAGIEQLISEKAPANIREAGATTNYTQLIELLDPVFDQKTDMMRGNSRVIYCGKTALNAFHDIGRLSGEYKIVQQQTTYGLRFSSLQIPRGVFQLVEHPIFNTNPEWQKLAVIADLSSFDFAYLEGRDTEVTMINENNNATDGTDATGGIYTTELTIELQNPFAWGMIYNLTAGAAV